MSVHSPGDHRSADMEVYDVNNQPVKRRTGKRATLGAPYGSERPRRAVESSSTGQEGGVAPAGAARGNGDIRVTVLRDDGLCVERLVSGLELERLRWPDIALRNTFEIMMRDFWRTAEEMERKKRDG